MLAVIPFLDCFQDEAIANVRTLRKRTVWAQSILKFILSKASGEIQTPCSYGLSLCHGCLSACSAVGFWTQRRQKLQTPWSQTPPKGKWRVILACISKAPCYSSLQHNPMTIYTIWGKLELGPSGDSWHGPWNTLPTSKSDLGQSNSMRSSWDVEGMWRKSPFADVNWKWKINFNIRNTQKNYLSMILGEVLQQEKSATLRCKFLTGKDVYLFYALQNPDTLHRGCAISICQASASNVNYGQPCSTPPWKPSFLSSLPKPQMTCWVPLFLRFSLAKGHLLKCCFG